MTIFLHIDFGAAEPHVGQVKAVLAGTAQQTSRATLPGVRTADTVTLAP